MAATLIPSVETPVSLTDLAKALDGGFQKVMGSRFPTPQAMAAGFSQLCLESGNGAKARCYDFHNEKLSSSWEGKFQQYRCNEIFDAQMTALAHAKGPCTDSPWRGGPLRLVYLDPPHPWSSFVAFDTADLGAARYIEFLSTYDRYKAAWHALMAGDVVAFSYALHDAGYYTADKSQYTAGLVSIAHRSLSLCDATLSNETHVFSGEEIKNITAIGQIALVDVIWNQDRHHPELGLA